MIIEQRPTNFSKNPQIVSSMAKSRRREVSPAEPPYRLAKVLVDQEKWEDAIATYHQALTIAPTWVEVQRELGDLLLKLERWDEAVKVYKTAITLQPDVAQVHHNLGDALLKLQRWDEAVVAYQKAIELNPEFSWSYNNLGDALRELQRWNEAVVAYQNAIKLKRDFALSYHNLGEVLAKKEEWEEAIAVYQKAIDLDPNFVWSYYNLAGIYGQLGQWDEAVEAYRQALKIQPDLPDVEEKLNQVLHHQVKAKLEQALSYYRQAIEKDPTDVESYQKALEIMPDDAELYFGLGSAWIAKGEEEKAIAVYESAIRINPGLNEAKFKLEQLLKQTISQQSVKGCEQEEIKDNALTTNIAQVTSDIAVNSQTTDVRLIAFYLPQYHPIPENDEWWGKGFTEWTNVTKAQPLFKGHYQPKLPADLGFYDLRLPEVRDAQARLAKKYGIYGFCYYYYWFAGKRLLHAPLDEVLVSKKPDFPFCVCWANENWSRRWDGSESDILIAQEHSFENNKAFAESLVPFMKDERYIRVNGKPLVLIYRANILPDIEETVRLWRKVWRENDLGEVYLCGCLSFGQQSSEILSWGFDAGVQFPPHGVPAKSIDPATLGIPNYEGSIYDFTSIVENSLMAKMSLPSEKEILSVITAWDNTARKGKLGNAYIHANPELYELWLRGAIEKTKQIYTGDEQLVFINAWNEWAEGTYLEPDRKYGHQYLQATSKALNETYSLQTAFGLLRYLPIQTKEHLTHLITQLELRINNLERSIELMIEMAKTAKQKYVFFEDIQFIDWDNTPTYLDNPSQGKKFNFSDYLIFSGWCFSKKAQEVIELKVVDQQREIITIPLREERSDVYNAYPECQQLNTGFSTQIKVKNLLDNKEYSQLDVYAIFSNNQSIKVVNINCKIIEEEKKISGILTARIKWYYTYKENISQLIIRLYDLPPSNLEFKHLSDEIEEIINHYIFLLNSLKKVNFFRENQ